MSDPANGCAAELLFEKAFLKQPGPVNADQVLLRTRTMKGIELAS